MSLHFEINGRRDLPILFCVHGLLGGPENFRAMTDKWEGTFCMVIVDLHAHMRNGGLIQLTQESLMNLHYDGAAEQILTFLDSEFPGRNCYFAGLSLGGKITYEFSGRAPERFLGAVVTDVGPGSLSDSSLYQFVCKTIPSLDLTLPWPELKAQLLEMVPDRSMRVMLQTQLYYPVPGGAAKWRSGLSGMKEFLEQQSIRDQWPAIRKFGAYLEQEKPQPAPRFIVYKASALSAISEELLAQMRELPFLELRPVSGTSHFVHVSHRKEIEESVLLLLKEEEDFSNDRGDWRGPQEETRC